MCDPIYKDPLAIGTCLCLLLGLANGWVQKGPVFVRYARIWAMGFIFCFAALLCTCYGIFLLQTKRISGEGLFDLFSLVSAWAIFCFWVFLAFLFGTGATRLFQRQGRGEAVKLLGMAVGPVAAFFALVMIWGWLRPVLVK